MSDSHSLTLAEPSEYELIEAAMTESVRGRRFLAEYARRNRSADTEVLLTAIERLENAVVREPGGEDVGRLRGDLMEMAEAIARTKAEITAISSPGEDQSRLTVASEALDAIVRATERATSDILGAAEEVQEAAWTLRETGAESEICDELDRRATQIYTACSFQDLTAQRTSRIVHTLRYLEDRIASMIAIWGRRLDEMPPGPDAVPRAAAIPAADLDQSDVDRFLAGDPDALHEPAPRPVAPDLARDDDLTFLPEAAEASPPAMKPDPNPAPSFDAADDDLAHAFDDLDKLSVEEKIALFS